MNIDQYQQAAVSLAVYPGRSAPLGMTYCGLKLAGEAGEVNEKIAEFLAESINNEEVEVALLKELGDELWYVAALADELGFALSEITFGVEDLNQFQDAIDALDAPGGLALWGAKLSAASGRVAEMIGKAIRDDGLMEPEGDLSPDREQKIVQALYATLVCISALSSEIEYPLGEVAQTNLDKLVDRKERGVLQGSGDNR